MSKAEAILSRLLDLADDLHTVLCDLDDEDGLGDYSAPLCIAEEILPAARDLMDAKDEEEADHE